MKKILVLCLSLLMLTAIGCKSTADGDAASASASAAAAGAKEESAKAAPACAIIQLDPNAIVRDDVLAVLKSFAEELEIAGKNANGDCDKFIKNQSDLLDACGQNFSIAMAAAFKDKSIELGERPSYELRTKMAEQCKGKAMDEIERRIKDLAVKAIRQSGVPF